MYKNERSLKNLGAMDARVWTNMVSYMHPSPAYAYLYTEYTCTWRTKNSTLPTVALRFLNNRLSTIEYLLKRLPRVKTPSKLKFNAVRVSIFASEMD